MSAGFKHGVWSVFFCLSSAAWAGPLARSDVPATLKDWLPWAMQGHEAALCPAPYNGDASKACVWPSRLDLRASSGGAVFKFDVQVFGPPAMVALPGEATHWPQNVKVDGKPLAVAEADGRPVAQLEPGRHAIEGTVPWKETPQDLLLPKGVGSVVLWVDGTLVSRAPDGDGRVWLKQTQQASASTEAVTVHTSRLIDDQVPLRVITHYDIAVSGKAREIELPAALLPGFVPEALSSTLPARLLDGGKLVVQGRPGNWSVDLTGRLMTPVQALTLPAGAASADEVWSFAAHNDVRLVSVEGAPAIDPKQVDMPDAWRAYPAYQLKPGATLKLTQTRRGNPVPNPDNLTINRELWLDFDGRGYTVHDEISGTLSRSSRLEMASPGELGRASINGEDQPVTRFKKGGPDGIEVRNGSAQLSADSRVDGAAWSLPAAGWKVDFNHVGAVLNLPPGWRLLHASGVDSAEGSWVSRWTLWDFFFVLLSALAAGKLFGWKTGALLGAALVVSWHMPDAPRSLWLVLLGLQALVKVLPQGRLLMLSHWLAQGCAVLIALVLLPYAVQQVRLSMYPALERPWQTMGTEPVRGVLAEDEAKPGAVPGVARREAEAAVAAAPVQENSAETDSMSSMSSYSLRSARSKAAVMPAKTVAPRLDEFDPNAKVQTGPGLPSWRWNEFRLSWQGPVQASQTLRLYLLPPAGTVVLRLGSLALMVLALLRLLSGASGGLLGGVWPTRKAADDASGAVAAMLVACTMLAAPGHVQAAQPDLVDAPATSVLDELRAKLTAPPDCMPHCADVPRALLVASGSHIQLRAEVHALADVSLPLPGQGTNWRPSFVSVDGKPAAVRRDDAGALWIAVSKGVSQVVLEADVGDVASVDIALPLPVREVRAQTEGWTLSGLDARGVPSGALSLSREQTAGRSEDRGTQRDALPPFVQIERTLHLGLRWTLTTRIVRAAPSQAPVQVRVHLLPGEAVNDAAAQVQDGVATVQLGGDNEAAFVSSLQAAPQLTWRSGNEPNQIERWTLDASTQWHISLSGIAPVVHQQNGRWLPTWQPWPGEQAVIEVSKPTGVTGQTFTVDRVAATVNPGVRATDVSALISLRSSQGGNHRVQLPESSELLGVTMDGQLLPVQAQGGVVMVPITPGAHALKIDWREARGIGWLFKSSSLGVGAPGVNDQISIEVPTSRVVLLVGGPAVGPAVLFWGVLLVIVAAAIGLARSGVTPLTALAWALLGIGIAQASLWGVVVVVGWFMAMEGRRRVGQKLSRRSFIAVQILLGLWTISAAGVLLDAVQVGLLGYPDLMIVGNGSDAQHLHWYADRFEQSTATAWVLSAPVYVYRIVMLLWALWLAGSLLRWVKWAWDCYSAGGYWPEKVAEPTKLSDTASPA